jgi:hypothetical protein
LTELGKRKIGRLTDRLFCRIWLQQKPLKNIPEIIPAKEEAPAPWMVSGLFFHL